MKSKQRRDLYERVIFEDAFIKGMIDPDGLRRLQETGILPEQGFELVNLLDPKMLERTRPDRLFAFQARVPKGTD